MRKIVLTENQISNLSKHILQERNFKDNFKIENNTEPA